MSGRFRRPTDNYDSAISFAPTEVHRRSSTRRSPRWCHVVVLRAALGRDLNSRADAVAVALGSFQRDVQPVPAPGLRFIQISAGCARARSRHRSCHPVQVANARPRWRAGGDASNPLRGERLQRRWRRRWRQGSGTRCCAAPPWCSASRGTTRLAADEQILPSVVVEVEESYAETRHPHAQLAHAARRGHFWKPFPAMFFHKGKVWFSSAAVTRSGIRRC